MSGECERFAAAVNAVLDGDAPASALAHAHALACRDCRKLAAAARLLASAGPALRASPPVPATLTPKLLAATRPRRRWPAAVAVAVVVGFFVGRVESSRSDTALSPTPLVLVDSTRPTKSPRVSDQLASVASVARSASAKVAAPARLMPDALLAPAAPPRQDAPDQAPLARLEHATRATAEPVTGTARRAVGLFLRDLGLSAKPAG